MPEQIAMATQQRRLLVLAAIQRLSRTRSWVTQRDLVADLRTQGYEVAKHHVLRDLRALMLIHPELSCHDGQEPAGPRRRGVEYGYRWAARDAPPPGGLSLPEALSLVMVEKHLRHALPVSLQGALQQLFDRAASTLAIQRRHEVSQWQDKAQVVPVGMPLLPPTIRPDILALLQEALLAEEQVAASYTNAKGETRTCHFHPLGMMARGQVLYLVALADDHDSPYWYALHRFTGASRLHLPARRPAGFVLQDHVAQAGHFGSGKPVWLEALIAPKLAAILQETPLDTSQQLGESQKDGWCTLRVRVRESWQLNWWLKQQVDFMVIRKPLVLRQWMEKLAREVLARYAREDAGRRGNRLQDRR